MKINEKGMRRLSILVSAILHLVLLILPFSKAPTEFKLETDMQSIPVQIERVQKKIKSPPKKVRRQHKRKDNKSQQQRPKASRKKNKKPVPATASKSKSVPGDRSAPVLASKTVPVYPKSALNYNLEGTVVVQFAINTKGRAVRHRILQSSGHESLDASFIRAVKENYRFKPKRVQGKNHIGQIKLTYTFKLEDA